jgi:hypothetical protein
MSAEEYVSGGAASTSASAEDLEQVSTTAVFSILFSLLDRNQRGIVDEADVVAALQCQLGSMEVAAEEVAKMSAGGAIDAISFRALFDRVDRVYPSVSAGTRHERAVRLVLAIMRDFGRRTTTSGDFALAARSRVLEKDIRQLEQRRRRFVLERQQKAEREQVGRAQEVEAREFNRQWKQRMEEFGKLASQAVAEMRLKHESTLEDFVAVNRPLLIDQFQLRRDKETLDAMSTLKRLQVGGDYEACEKYAKLVETQLRKDNEAAEGKAEEELQRKLEVHRWHQRLELKGLMAKCERIRSERRSEWEDALSKLVLQQKNAAADVHARQQREAKRAQLALRTALEPAPRPSSRLEPRGNYSLLSPRRPASRGSPRAVCSMSVGSAAWPPGLLKPPPTQRPSRMAAAGQLTGYAACGPPPPSPHAQFPPRPFSSEHVPRSRRPLVITPRPMTSGS